MPARARYRVAGSSTSGTEPGSSSTIVAATWLCQPPLQLQAWLLASTRPARVLQSILSRAAGRIHTPSRRRCSDTSVEYFPFRYNTSAARVSNNSRLHIGLLLKFSPHLSETIQQANRGAVIALSQALEVPLSVLEKKQGLDWPRKNPQDSKCCDKNSGQSEATSRVP